MFIVRDVTNQQESFEESIRFSDSFKAIKAKLNNPKYKIKARHKIKAYMIKAIASKVIRSKPTNGVKFDVLVPESLRIHDDVVL